MRKFVGWVIFLALLTLVAYALLSGLASDVVDPWTPPGPR